MSNLQLVKQEKINLLNSIFSEIELREKSINQVSREKESLENQAFVVQGAIAMIDELIAGEEKQEDKSEEE